MRRRAVTNRIKTVALTDPQPEFVSLVKAGANGTPWLAVKDDESGPALKVDRVGLGVRGYEVIGVTFAKTEKWTKESAKEWLDAGGYEGYSLEETDDAVVAKSTDELPADAKVSLVEMDGLKVAIVKTEVAKKAEDVNPGADKAPEGDVAAKDEKPVETSALGVIAKRFDEYAGYYSETPSTLSEALKAGNDGVPPGYYEIETAFRVTLFRAMREEPALVPTITREFGEVIQKMADAFNGFVGRNKADAEANMDAWMGGKSEDKNMTTKTDAPAKPAVKQDAPASEGKPTAVENEAAQKGGADPTKEQSAETAPEQPAADEPKDTAKEEAPKEPSLAEQIAAAVKAAMEPVVALVAEVSKKTDDAKAALEQRVASLETEGPSRKSADVDEAPAGSKSEKQDSAEDEFARRALRSSLGISGGANAFTQRKR